MSITAFCALPEAKEAKLSEAEVVGLRLYTGENSTLRSSVFAPPPARLLHLPLRCTTFPVAVPNRAAIPACDRFEPVTPPSSQALSSRR